MSKLKQPAPAEIRAARLEAGLTQAEAAELVHAGSGSRRERTWQHWEADPSSPESRRMPLAAWELFLLKTAGRRRNRTSG